MRTITIFVSWQTVTDKYKFRNKKVILKAVNMAVAEIKRRNDIENIIFEVHESTSGVAGTPLIPQVIDDRCKTDNIVIGDFTLTEKYNLFQLVWAKLRRKDIRSHFSDNVEIEVGKALGAKPSENLILVGNLAMGDFTKMPIPFDIAQHRAPISFMLKDDTQESRDNAIKTLVPILRHAIVASAKEVIKQRQDFARPFCSWYDQNAKKQMNEQFEWTEDLAELKNQIVNPSNKLLRLCGLSGTGKTRLVWESFNEDPMENNYWYCDSQYYTDESILTKAEEFFLKDEDAILIVDNCDLALHHKLQSLYASNAAKNRLITIFHNPAEEDIDGAATLRMAMKYPSVVEKLLDRYMDFYPTQEDRDKLIQFSGGIPMVAILLIDGIKKGNAMGVITDASLMDKVLGYKEHEDKRKMLQSLALFSWLGYYGDYKKHAEFIETNKKITPISKDNVVLMVEFDDLVLELQRRDLLERSGRLIGLRPMPIALYLAAEWIKHCSEERMVEVVQIIQKSPYASELIDRFCERFKYMGYLDHARMMVNKMLGEDSPFGSAEVINTEMGSHLFRSLVEVDPESVADSLWRTLSVLDTDQLRKMENGRRNLVWTVEKLCFDPRTFDKGAQLMLRMAIAENEHISNNATGEFVRLFPIYLPATAVDLDTRLDFLRSHFAVESEREVVSFGVESALQTHDFMYVVGAETQGTKELTHYNPKRDEVLRYLQGCMDIIVQDLQSSAHPLKWDDVFEKNLLSWVDTGLGDTLLGYVEQVCELKQWDWAKLRKTIDFVQHSRKDRIRTKDAEKLEEIKKRLTKDDFVTRYNLANESTFWNNRNSSNEEYSKWEQDTYGALAKELADTQDFSGKTLSALYAADDYSINPMGRMLGETMKDGVKAFVDQSVQFFKTQEKWNASLFVEFLANISEKNYAYAKNVLIENNLTLLLCAAIGRRMKKWEDAEVEEMLNWYKKGIIHYEDIIRFWANAPIYRYKEEGILSIIKRIYEAASEEERLKMVLQLSMMRCHSETEKYPKIEEFLAECMNAEPNAFEMLFDEEKYWFWVEHMLMDDNRTELATYINVHVLGYLASHSYLDNYHFERVYKILCSKYFDVIWPLLSDSLLAKDDEIMLFFRLKNLLGSMIGGVYNEVGILFQEDHNEALMKWCEEHKDIAPERLALMAPVFGDDGQFSPIMKAIIERYGMMPNVQSEINSNLNTYGVTGSSVPLFEQRKRALQEYANYKVPTISAWANEMIKQTDKEIEYTRNYEAEMFK